MRRYGAWAGRPRGVREDPNRCIVEVSDRVSRGFLYKQCMNKRVTGAGLCQQHANMYATGHHLHIPKDEVTS